MGKFSKFRGDIKFTVAGEIIEVKSLNVSETDKLMKMTDKNINLEELIKIITEILVKAYPDEDVEDTEAFVLKNTNEIIEGLMIGMGWTTKEKVAAQKKKMEAEAIKEAEMETDKKKE